MNIEDRLSVIETEKRLSKIPMCLAVKIVSIITHQFVCTGLQVMGIPKLGKTTGASIGKRKIDVSAIVENILMTERPI